MVHIYICVCVCVESGLTGFKEVFIAHCNSLGKVVRPEVTYSLLLEKTIERHNCNTHS